MKFWGVGGRGVKRVVARGSEKEREQSTLVHRSARDMRERETHTHTHTHTHNRSYNKFQACNNHAQKRHFEFGGDCAVWLGYDAFLANFIVLVFFGLFYKGGCRVEGVPGIAGVEQRGSKTWIY